MSAANVTRIETWFDNEAEEEGMRYVNNHGAILERAGLTQQQLIKAVNQAEVFHHYFKEKFGSEVRGDHLPAITPDAAEQKFIRRNGGVPDAVIAKLSSNSISKRKPAAENRAPFMAYVRGQFETAQPLLFRLGIGPVKNVQHYGANQAPDLAEYLTLMKLAHTMMSVAAIYPFGVKVEMIADDKRGGGANLWPIEYGQKYIDGVRDLISTLGFNNWLTVENEQDRLYKHYNVMGFYAAAEESLQRWAKNDPVAFAAKLETATQKASDNLVGATPEHPMTKIEVRESAWRYIVALKAEELSGIFAPIDAFPLRYGNHPNCFQFYTMGEGQTKLPWQVVLPRDLIVRDADILPLRPIEPVRAIFLRQEPGLA